MQVINIFKEMKMNAKHTIKLLLVDDESDIIDVLREELIDKIRLDPNMIMQTSSGNSAIQLLQSGKEFDLIISDYSMNDGNGIRILNYLVINNIRTKFIFYTSTAHFELPQASDHLLAIFKKSDIVLLIKCVQNFILSNFNASRF